jgi:hypothetical protein
VNIVILNWQRPLWEGDQEVVKRSGRDEPMWVVLHMCMESMIGISLYNYLHLKLAKTLCFSFYPSCFFFNKITRGWNRFCKSQGRGEMAMCIHMKVNVKMIKIKFKNKKRTISGLSGTF